MAPKPKVFFPKFQGVTRGHVEEVGFLIRVRTFCVYHGVCGALKVRPGERPSKTVYLPTYLPLDEGENKD